MPTGDGLFGWGAELEEVFTGLDRLLTRVGRDAGTRVLRFPPMISREVFEQSEFGQSFPQLFGTVHAFAGDDRDHVMLSRAMAERTAWPDVVRPTRYVLTPAACYPVYPQYAGRPDADAVVDTSSYCFRHEPSEEVGRLVAFRQREFVRIGTSRDVDAWFGSWRDRALTVIRSLGLVARCEPAADPFFGRGARLLASGQREQGLKYEIITEIDGHPVAVASCNNHRDHFGRTFGIEASGGEVAATSCIGFGQERIAFALASAFGPDLTGWPSETRDALWG
ncbi:MULTISPECIES: hypothetical protein [Actinoplanes]|uniref:hypothetical protein n=1 Tax=Actinoplanes TaxID=1865 RepID=UPI001FE08D64|nr:MULTISPECIES: hypothetical protein [Actinoplanes]GLY02726.1 amino acid--[acyl-carrier-protein] ligase [Actinoplanes sp. NBRC 101535]